MADETKDILEQLLSDLYARQSVNASEFGPSYLQAESGQFLGKITDSQHDINSMLNQYGPYGSPYSPTSIFNQYSQFGSPYGIESVNNAYCATAPKLFLGGRFVGRVTTNQFAHDRIPTPAFLYALKHATRDLMAGKMVGSESEARQQSGESYIEGGDGTFLGKVVGNKFDALSIFNKFGQHGSKFSPTSVFNKFSPHGSQLTPTGARNRFATDPPRIYIGGKFVAYLSENPMKKPRIDVDSLLEWAEENAPRR